jgi:hypothetical protein
MPALIFPAPGPVGNNNAQWTDTANSFTGFSVTESFISNKTSLQLKNPLPKNNEVNNRRVGNVNRRDVIRNPLPKNNEVNIFKVIGEVSKGIVVKNAFPKDLDEKVFDVNLIQPLKLNTSRTQVFSLNKIVTGLNKAFTVLRTPLPNRLFGKLKSSREVKVDGIFSLRTTIANVSSNIGQNTVSTTTAPKNARENFYYFTIAPGKRQDLARDIFFRTTPGLIDIRSLSRQANITSNVAQANVNTKLAPTNARENFYYFTIAPGKRADQARDIWSQPPLSIVSNVIIKVDASANVNYSGKKGADRLQLFSLGTTIANVSSNVRQNTVSTLLEPTNARENFYYFTIAPGKRADKARAPWSKTLPAYINIAALNGRQANISSNVRQNTVSTLVSPTNARENFYYFTIAPGKRADKARAPWSKPLIITVIKDARGIITSNVRQNTVSTLLEPTNARENFYYFNIAPGKRVDKSRRPWSNALLPTVPAFPKSLESKVVTVLNNPKLIVKTPLSGRVYLDTLNVSNFIAQSNVYPTTAPTTPGENLYYAIIAPGLYSSRSRFAATPTPQNRFNVTELNKAYIALKPAFPKSLEEQRYKVSTLKSGFVARNVFLKDLDEKVFDVSYGNFKTPFTKTQVFNLNTTIPQLNKAYIALKDVFPKEFDTKKFNSNFISKGFVVRNAFSKFFEETIFDTNTLTKPIVVIKNAVSKEYDQRVFKVDLIEPFKLNQFQSTVFNLQPNLGKIASIISKTGRVFSAADPAFRVKSEPLQFWN